MAVTFSDLHTEAGLKSLEEYLSGKAYISGDQITRDDVKVFATVSQKPGLAFPNASRWYETVSSVLAARIIFFGEYECIGPGANNTFRASFSKQLGHFKAAQYMDISYIQGNKWLLQNDQTD